MHATRNEVRKVRRPGRQVRLVALAAIVAALTLTTLQATADGVIKPPAAAPMPIQQEAKTVDWIRRLPERIFDLISLAVDAALDR